MSDVKNEGNILVLTYWTYPDALTQTYTLPYLSTIRKDDKVRSGELTRSPFFELGPHGIHPCVLTKKPVRVFVGVCLPSSPRDVAVVAIGPDHLFSLVGLARFWRVYPPI
jgi:hypothetical protein